VIALVAADILGLKPEQIVVRVGDALSGSGGSGGNTTTASVAPAIQRLHQRWLNCKRNPASMMCAASWAEACKNSG
jgi:CO/xanthine dehydrogenase Mo-binding subunit